MDGQVESPTKRKKNGTVPVLKVKLLSPNAFVPVRAEPGAAGYDLRTQEDFCLLGNSTVVVSIGIAIEVPEEHFGHILERSSLALKRIKVGGGVVDGSYRGEVKVILHNLSADLIDFKRGDKVAQLVLQRIAEADVEVVEELSETVRGSGGFGSTGR